MKEALHRLVDELPDDDLYLEAVAKLVISVRSDPVLRAFAEAPFDDEPLTEDDTKAIEEGKTDREMIPWEEVKADLAGDGVRSRS